MTWALCDPADSAIGLDLSHWQGTEIPWAESMELGVEWAVSKTWHGRGLVQTARPQLDSARSAGMETLGRYAWLLPDEDLNAQVRAWTSIPREWDEVPLTIDFEEPSTKLRGRALVEKLEYVVSEVSQRTGELPEVYTGEWYWVGYCNDLDSEVVASCPLWLAAYPRKNTTGTRYREAIAEVCGGVMPRVPRPWRDRAFDPIAYQFDGDRGLYLPRVGAPGAASAIDVDVNVGSRSRIHALLPRPRREPAPTFPDTPANPIGWETRAEADAAEVADADPAPPVPAEDGATTTPSTPAAKRN